MAEQNTLTAQRREVVGRHLGQLRRQGIVPANIFGRGRPSVAIQIDGHDLKKLLAAHGGSKLIQLQVDGARETAIVRHIGRDPRTGQIEHVDFMHIEMTEKMRARVPLRLVGEAPAVRQLDGVLLHLVDTLEVECLPQELPEALELDISGMDSLDAGLHARDIKLPAGVSLMADPDEAVVKMTPPRMVQEEVAPAAEAAATPAGSAAETGTAASTADEE
jgi:large subunit ribosomal protein L25